MGAPASSPACAKRIQEKMPARTPGRPQGGNESSCTRPPLRVGPRTAPECDCLGAGSFQGRESAHGACVQLTLRAMPPSASGPGAIAMESSVTVPPRADQVTPKPVSSERVRSMYPDRNPDRNSSRRRRPSRSRTDCPGAGTPARFRRRAESRPQRPPSSPRKPRRATTLTSPSPRGQGWAGPGFRSGQVVAPSGGIIGLLGRQFRPASQRQV